MKEKLTKALGLVQACVEEVCDSDLELASQLTDCEEILTEALRSLPGGRAVADGYDE